jgi:hypothetical protein
MLQYTIRRRIIKTSLKITKRGEQKVAEVLIPDNVFNIVGVMVTSSLRSSIAIETSKVYWGAFSGVYSIVSFQHQDAENKNIVISQALDNAEHCAIAIPRKWGRPDVYVNGYAGGLKNPRFETITDPDTGYTESYQILESNQNGLQLDGNIHIELKW